jgi:hypothetical protein
MKGLVFIIVAKLIAPNPITAKYNTYNNVDFIRNHVDQDILSRNLPVTKDTIVGEFRKIHSEKYVRRLLKPGKNFSSEFNIYACSVDNA